MTKNEENKIGSIILILLFAGWALYISRWFILIASIAYIIWFLFTEGIDSIFDLKKTKNIIALVAMLLVIITILLFGPQLWIDLNYFYSIVRNWIINLF